MEQPSKTQLKQEASNLQRLGEKLTSYNPVTLRKLPVSDALISAIEEFNRLPNSHGARKRQLQFIGKLMRKIDYDALHQAMLSLESASLKKKKKPPVAISWCKRILQSGDSEINALIELYPQLERQTIRQLYREYMRAKEDNRSKFKVKLQHYLQQYLKD